MKVLPFDVSLLMVFVSQHRNIHLLLFGFLQKCVFFRHISDINVQIWKLNDRYYFETDKFFNTTGGNTEKVHVITLPPVVENTISQLGNYTPTLSRPEFFPQENTFCRKPTQRPATQKPVMFVIHMEGFHMNTGNRNRNVVTEEPAFTQISMSSTLAFVSVYK